MKNGAAGSRYGGVAWVLVIMMTVLAVGRVILTYPVFSQTSDELNHIAAGMELLDRGVYTYEVDHPPLARVASAIGPYLLGRRSHGETWLRTEGKEILFDGGDPTLTLAAARAGILPFLVVAVFVVWSWAKALGGPITGALAVLLFTMLPVVLAHSGLATTDAAGMAFVAAGIWSFARWLDTPRYSVAALVGLSWSLAIVSKMSALLFLPLGALTAVALWAIGSRTSSLSNRVTPSAAIGHGLLAGLLGFGLIWLCYGFSVAYPLRLGGRIPVPAWELAQGALAVSEHAKLGHSSYLLGETSQAGWWYFFPVAIAVKTPVPFLILSAIGAWASVTRAWRDGNWLLALPLAFSVAVLLVVMPANLNIGLRHVLPIFPALAVVGALGAVALWNASFLRPAGPAVLVALLLWLVVDTTRAHPDYLAYFNETARSSPERVLINSDLDWGQDFYRLVAEAKRRGIDSIAVAFWGSIDLERQGLPGMRRLEPGERPTGWVAASDLYRAGLADPGFAWLQKEQPVARIGKTIWLYYFP